MGQGVQVEELRNQKRIGLGVAGLAVLAILWATLEWFDNTTELVPAHNGVLESCFAIAGLGGLVAGCLLFLRSRRMNLWPRVVLASCSMLACFLIVFVLSSRTADIIEGRIDFPPAQTKTFLALLKISRAYQTHGKGRSWNIQTMPIWSNLDITEKDYRFMLAHRRPVDSTSNPDEIYSNGFFCARVTLQESTHAVRVFHAGSHALPEGTIVLCPSNSSGPQVK